MQTMKKQKMPLQTPTVSVEDDEGIIFYPEIIGELVDLTAGAWANCIAEKSILIQNGMC